MKRTQEAHTSRGQVAESVRALHPRQLVDVLRSLRGQESYQGFPAALIDSVECTTGSECAWLNTLLATLWPSMRAHLERVITVSIEDALNAIKETSPVRVEVLRCSKFSLGHAPLRCNSLKAHSRSGSDLVIDLDVELFTSGEEVTIEGAIANVSISGIQFRAPIRLVLTPLVGEPPYFGALGISLLHNPFVDFRVETRGLDWLGLPLMHEWLRKTLRTSLESFQWPSQTWVEAIDLESMENLKHLSQRFPAGVLQVRLNGARGVVISGTGPHKSESQGVVSRLVRTAMLAMSQPGICAASERIRVELGVGDCRILSGAPRCCGQNSMLEPKWDSSFVLLVHDIKHEHLDIRLETAITRSGDDDATHSTDEASIGRGSVGGGFGGESDTDNRGVRPSGSFALYKIRKPGVPQTVECPLSDGSVVTVTLYYRPISVVEGQLAREKMNNGAPNQDKNQRRRRMNDSDYYGAEYSSESLSGSEYEEGYSSSSKPWSSSLGPDSDGVDEESDGERRSAAGGWTPPFSLLPKGCGIAAHGVLMVELLRAESLPSMDFNGKSDPFCRLVVGQSERCSPVIHAQLNPTWHPAFRCFFTIMDGFEAMLRIEMWDQDQLTEDDLICACILPVRDVLNAAAQNNTPGKRISSRKEREQKMMGAVSGGSVEHRLPLAPHDSPAVGDVGFDRRGGAGFVIIRTQWLALKH